MVSIIHDIFKDNVKIPFLDILVVKRKNGLGQTVNRKTAHQLISTSVWNQYPIRCRCLHLFVISFQSAHNICSNRNQTSDAAKQKSEETVMHAL